MDEFKYTPRTRDDRVRDSTTVRDSDEMTYRLPSTGFHGVTSTPRPVSEEMIDAEIRDLQRQLDRINAQNQSLHASMIERAAEQDRLRSVVPESESETLPKVRFSNIDNTLFPGTHGRDTNVTRRKLPAVPVKTSTADAAAAASDTDDSDEETAPLTTRPKLVSVKASTYDGSTPWKDFLSHFEAVARINKWSKTEKGLYLAVSLRGQAQGILGDLPKGKQENFKSLVKALEERFAPPNQDELYRAQLVERRQKATESLPELGQAIRRLVNLAYPTVPSDVRDTLAKQHFIEALVDSDMRIRIKQSRPVNLTDAIRTAVELEAYKKADRQSIEGKSHIRTAKSDQSDSPGFSKDMEEVLKKIQTQLEVVQKDISQLKASRNRQYERKMNSGAQSNNSTPRPVNDTKSRTAYQSNRKCFKCGGDHFMRNCPKRRYSTLNRTDRNTSERGSAKPVRTRVRQKQNKMGLGISSAARDAGLYMKASIHNVPVRLLVDTGATITIISKEVYEKMTDTMRPYLQPVERDIVTANGAELEVFGKANFIIKPDGCDEIYIEAVVASISTDGLLGLDFMAARHALLDMEHGCLSLGDTQIKLNYEGPLGCFRVCTTERVSIPAKSEMIVAGKICSANQETEDNVFLIEGAETFIKLDKSLVARTLVSAQNNVPVRVLNLNDENHTIYPGTTIAMASPVDEVIQTAREENKQTQDELREDIGQLLERSKEHLNQTQHTQAKQLLIKYQNLFAASDSDLGRTGNIKYRINTASQESASSFTRRGQSTGR